MPILAYTKKMLDTVAQNKAMFPESRELFERFVQAVGRQIRQPYHKRHSAEETAEHLAEVFSVLCETAPGAISLHGQLQGRVMVLTSVMADQAFIVDTLRMRLQAYGAVNITGFNCVVPVRRDGGGVPVEIGNPGDHLESVVRLEVEGIAAEQLDELLSELRNGLQLSRAMVQDFSAMTTLVESATLHLSRMADVQPTQGDVHRETAAFLRWLLADNFVFMGLVHGDSRLGFAREGVQERWPIDPLMQWASTDGDMPVQVRKGHRESPVHRSGRVDEVRVEIPDQNGSRVLYIQGLFTYRALTQPSRHVPMLRRVLGQILHTEGAQTGSYRYKGIANVFDSLPTEFLFTATPEQTINIINQVLEAEQEQEVRAQLLQSDDTFFVLVAMPRVRWSERLSEQIEEVLITGTGASYTDQGVFVSRYNTMLVHFYLTGTRRLVEDELGALRGRILDLATPWEMRLYETLSAVMGTEQADLLTAKYAAAFDEVYRMNRPTSESVQDIQRLEVLQNENRSVLAHVFSEYRGRLYLRVYQRDNILLSHMLPVLDHFGLVIIDQFADPVTLMDGTKMVIDTFRLQHIEGLTVEEILARGASLSEGIEAVFDNRTTSDTLNRLLVRVNLPWQAVDLLRAYHGYASQLGLYYSIDRVQTILLSRPEMVSLMWKYFVARFDPDLEGDRSHAMSVASEAFEDALRKVEAADQDLVFRTFFNLMQSSIRTNFYRMDRQFHYLSFKIKCDAVQNMPSPRMMYEIYVHHRDMEGIHLRGGPVARGGIRWSDRTDFRREVLDLVATQMVKNVLIVPVGAKGGFRMKHQIDNRAERRRRADELYQVLIRGMLDVTDNIVDGVTVHPPRVVIHDGEDPYLVVAADKGTAHLSDTANGLSREYGFWLDDAFASGGSNGYDHKKVGITARGGWVTARRHFLEMGINPYTESFTCVGIGDPGGDVFGNGVIETRQMKLLAAFNHMHVFIDPDPDPESSYEERMRLFREVKGWGGYNTDLISEGGGIFSRQAKSIPLSPQIQKMLGVLKDELPVEVVIRLLLRLNVDLLWNGGIGTYVKASHEDQIDAGDPSNDMLRINGSELRARIIGEGGNLGFTQAGRIEYALNGGRLNTDAIDNSGGVDMSDHEVNLKILFAPLVGGGVLTQDQRNVTLEEMTDEVADQVLYNNDVHGRQISLDVVRSQQDPMAFARTIDWACTSSGVNRADIRLPSNDELHRRSTLGKGLTRPELAVLNAHVKMHVFNAFSAADSSDIPDFSDLVLQYFPKRIQENYPEAIAGHMLHKSIGMTVLVNDIMGETGAWFFPGLIELTDAPASHIASAWIEVMDLINATQLRKDIADSGASLDAQYRAWTTVTASVFQLLALWLSPGECVPDEGVREQIRVVLGRLEALSGTVHQDRFRQRAEALSEMPEALARRIAVLGELTTANEVVGLPEEGLSLDESIVRYLSIGEASRLLPTIRALESRKASGGWDPVAIAIIRNRYIHQMRSLVRAFQLGPEAKLGVDRVTLRLTRNRLSDLAKRMDDVLADASDISALLVAEERLRGLIERDFVAVGGVRGTGV